MKLEQKRGNDMQKPFTDRARKVLTVSLEVARELRLPHITPSCMFAGLLRVQGSVAYRALMRVSWFSLQFIEINILARDRKACIEVNSCTSMTYDQESQRILRIAAQDSCCGYIGTEHLLMALCKTKNAARDAIYRELRIDTYSVQDAVEQVLATLAADSGKKNN